ncbi:hypothetical protein [Flavobacterium sp. KACC 22763]|uniref:hypothetical protein n=1 Tax=Flavobacterium sp. KACC 22763 TaxID=3025668 RepID=UPI0023672E31|nr:hypothetical protein [Flavobacterium sp. KACC 22763]WDF66066.1 hypothetical protein PQ463_07825 [Flavobacterium sp. KACC 22763]
MKSLFKKCTEPMVYHKFYLLAQKRWAEKMKGFTGGLSKRQLIWALLLFTVLTSGLLIYKLYRAFYKEAGVPEVSKTKKINLKN